MDQNYNFIVGILNSGIGNKLFLLLEHLYIYKLLKHSNPELKLYIINQRSHHEKTEKIHIDKLFEPIDNIEFLTWAQYDKLKSSIKQIIKKQPTYSESFLKSIEFPCVFDYILEHIPEIKHSIIDSFDIALHSPKKSVSDIGVHVRFGDKLLYPYDSYLFANPLYYIESIKSIRKPGESVTIYTDSPKIVEEFILPFIDKPVSISDSNPEDTVLEMAKIKKLVITDSTLPLAALVLRKSSCEVLFPKYKFTVKYPNFMFEIPKRIKFHYMPLEKISLFTFEQLKRFYKI